MPSKHELVLATEELEWLERARDWVKGHFTERPDEKYRTIDGKLRVIAANLEQHWIAPSETWKLQSLGIAFGDALAQKLMLEWVTVDDEYGRVPALNWPGTSILSFPLTAISKRIERGDEVDVWQLFDDTVEAITNLAHSGRFA